MKKTLRFFAILLMFIVAVGCAAQTKTQSIKPIDTSEYLKTPEGQEEITVIGRLYERRNGKEVPPSPGSVSIGYGDDKGKGNAILTVKNVDGKLKVTTTGETKVNADGTFEIKFKRGEIPPFNSRRIIILGYCRENSLYGGSFLTQKNGRDALAVDITGIKRVNFGDIEVK